MQDNSTASEGLETHQCPFFLNPYLPTQPIQPSQPTHPTFSLYFIQTTDGSGAQRVHEVSQTHLGLNILFTNPQQSANRNNSELMREKVRNSLQFVRVTAKVAVFSVPLLQCLLKADAITAHYLFNYLFVYFFHKYVSGVLYGSAQLAQKHMYVTDSNN